ncbi:hypothetical protein Lesp02_29120 [Lentzea sp. NBRC 105346]|uniref:hypothetical protein n=1 Tax=Lentzea sp. NBRC 105346 TaxID=3032205 RepID=UPI00255538AC|nr:hypothetical protein [Lentzea sp. NBRC 105346]GLZ30723.1 hypothetical protein Lesp02_29120 [Lentzea sp. NBRC 105346]
MSRESGSEHTQRTVAELLAQYGGSPDGAPRRRRRRAADDDESPETAPQTIIERVLSDSGRLMPVRDEPQVEAPKPPPPVAPPAAAPPAPPRPAPPRRPAPPAPGFQPAPQVRRPGPAEETRQVPQFQEGPSRTDVPRPDPAETRVDPIKARLDPAPPQQSRPDLPRPEASRPNIARPVPPAAPPREAMTEQLPRIPAKAPVDQIASLETESVLIVPPAPPKLPEPLAGQSPEDWFGDDDEPQPMEHTQAHPGPYVDDEDDDYADNYQPNYAREEDYLSDDEEPAGLSDADELDAEESEPRSAGKEWLVMIGQLAVGVLGGAVLWLAFNWLWRAIPVAALVVALAVTVGLVLLVRKIRRADDMQTTILAVLVGLIVTVSPAAMLLVKS